MKNRLMNGLMATACAMGVAASLAVLVGIVFAADEPLLNPDVERVATSARVDAACLTADVPLVDPNGVFVRMKAFTVCGTDDGLTGPQKVKLRDALVVMAKFKGLIP